MALFIVRVREKSARRKSSLDFHLEMDRYFILI
jgi:hypothetical protein